jgi:hypothetical protein
VTLDQADDEAVLRPAQQVAFPVTRDGPILNRCGPFADGDSIGNAAALICFLRGVPGAADRAPGPQMLHQLLLQHAASLHI